MPRLTHTLEVSSIFIGTSVLAGVLALDVPLERQLRCDRQTNTCAYTTAFLVRTRREHQPVSSMLAPRVDRSSSFLDSGYNVWVDHKYGQWQVGNYPTAAEADEVAGSIREFEQTPDSPHLVVGYSVVRDVWLLWGSVPAFGYLLVKILSGIVGKRSAADD
jgi:hypothetical protein